MFSQTSNKLARELVPNMPAKSRKFYAVIAMVVVTLAAAIYWFVQQAHWQAIAKENGRHYTAAQAIILTAQKPELDALRYYLPGLGFAPLDPYDRDEFPFYRYRDDLAEAVSKCLRNGKVSGQKWQELYDHLKALRYDMPDGVQRMIRTPEQLKQSRTVLLNIKN